MKKSSFRPPELKLNKDALNYAKKLIAQGKIDRASNSWFDNEPLIEQENHYLHENSWKQYSKWFLGIAPNTQTQTKEHYEFPIGDFKKIYRSGVVAVKERAAQWRQKQIEKAANELLKMIDEDAQA